MDDTATVKPIVVGVDGSASSIGALRKAVEIAATTGAPIEAITAWQFPITYDGTATAQSWDPERQAGMIASAAVDAAFPDGKPDQVEVVIAAGPAAPVLIRRSEDASMLIVGSRGRGGFVGLLLGSVSAACAQHAHCPVLIMHSTASGDSDRDRHDAQAKTADLADSVGA